MEAFFSNSSLFAFIYFAQGSRSQSLNGQAFFVTCSTLITLFFVLFCLSISFTFKTKSAILFLKSAMKIEKVEKVPAIDLPHLSCNKKNKK